MQIPKFLLEMSKQLNEQDNRSTADPIWVVCYDEWLTCADDRGDKEVILLSDGGCGDHIECGIEDYTEIFDYLTTYHEEWCWDVIKESNEEEDDLDEISNYFNPDDIYCQSELPEGVEIEKIAMQKVVHKLKYCLTESDANAFIKRKQHDYARLYTYVESMYFCPQMMELRNWIKGLSDER